MNRTLRVALAVAAITGLAACAGLPEARVQMPAAPSSQTAEWQAPVPTAGIAPSADWWTRFNDPMLPPLQAAAEAVSPTLASAAARIERARATRAAAGAALLPQADAVGSVGRARNLPGVAVTSSASLGLQAAWEIDLFGGAAAGRDAAQARVEAAQAGLQDARIALAAEVATSYAALRACEAQLLQSDADAASRDQTARLTDLSARAGFTAPADAALTRAGAAQARSTAVRQRADCDTQRKSLVELTDIPEPELRQRLAARMAVLPVPEPVAVNALPAQLLAQRPDIAEAARKVQAAAGDRRQAAADERPQVTLSGQLAGTALRTAGVSSRGSTWSLGPLSISFPLFDGGARAANTVAAQAAYDEAVAAYQAQVRRALREVEVQLVALQATAEREADARLAAQDFEASLRATEARQKGGLATLFELEAARRNALAAQSALIDLQRERTVAWIGLFRALGGGWAAPNPGT